MPPDKSLVWLSISTPSPPPRPAALPTRFKGTLLTSIPACINVFGDSCTDIPSLLISPGVVMDGSFRMTHAKRNNGWEKEATAVSAITNRR
ncbi:hypothetical protein GWI33_006971 [Rhynchophorus ferrugineus]|uniref:Uncharacterized protein n=1 Tax=Rhynchophorus ferrugineus TaxID=354439 RepID=A0A834IGS5_RHYFE|nr:hypothetical protein GWI33_006971 [Rhynchophorus ferrugineus]